MNLRMEVSVLAHKVITVSILLNTLCKADAGLCCLQPHKPGRHASASARSKHQAAKAGGHRQSIKASSQPTHSKQQRQQVAASRRWADVHRPEAAAVLMGFVILTLATCCGWASHTSGAVRAQPHYTIAELALLGCMSHKQGLFRLRCLTLTPAISGTTCSAGPQSTGSLSLPLFAQCSCRESHGHTMPLPAGP